MAKQWQPPPSVPAIVGTERVIFLTEAERPSRVIVLPKDSKPARVIGENPMTIAAKKAKGLSF